MIGLSQYNFTVVALSFLCSSARAVVCKWVYGSSLTLDGPNTVYDFGDLRNIWTYGAFFSLVLSLFAMVRNIALFSFTFIIGNFCLLFTVIAILGYAITHLLGSGADPTPSWVVLNSSGTIWSTLGFSVYMFEGIGILMPVMQACDCPEIFDSIIQSVVATITIIYILLGEITYFAYGTANKQLATQMLPQTSQVANLCILGYVIAMMFTYPIFIYPANTIFEGVTIDPITKTGSKTEFWLKNLQRTVVCISAVFLGIQFLDVLDKLIAFIGAAFCAPMAMITPALCHLILIAKTRREKIEDIVIIVISLFIMLFCLAQALGFQ
jgi:proton-coupled amino acid transporter